MRVRIDVKKCEGHALCALIAPDVFEVGDDDLSHVVADHLDHSVLLDLRAAEAACPTLAIALSEDD
ncbi:ferredoxin [Nocardia sp. alder85J]|uniref:ferredoxin n=1 Tax=Nocardia sp. alder85J TaxID=2862949 RepID=UPI001CD762E1|nr:ferredoxin [Nocardia sp. alder85J]MCX4091013.1 ferredoxin [Nocardia sp. alder85J]